MDRLRTVLIATDLSDASRSALAEASRLATLSGATLHAVHVIEDESSRQLAQILGANASPPDPQALALAQDLLMRQLAEVGAPEPGSVRVTYGSPIQEILEATRACGAELLVVGASGTSGRTGLGTTTVRCVRKAHAKVLVVPDSCHGPFHRVLACVDFSQSSPKVITQTARVGHIDGSDVTAIHCYRMPWEQALWGTMPLDALEIEAKYREALHQQFTSELLPYTHGYPMTLHTMQHADFSNGIVEYARVHESDLVVLGTTGRNTLANMLLGTTAEKVMRTVGCSVLAVKRGVDATTKPAMIEDSE